MDCWRAAIWAAIYLMLASATFFRGHSIGSILRVKCCARSVNNAWKLHRNSIRTTGKTENNGQWRRFAINNTMTRWIFICVTISMLHFQTNEGKKKNESKRFTFAGVCLLIRRWRDQNHNILLTTKCREIINAVRFTKLRSVYLSRFIFKRFFGFVQRLSEFWWRNEVFRLNGIVLFSFFFN